MSNLQNRRRFRKTNYRVSNYTLINDDCVSAMQSMTDGSVNLVVTSPPYNQKMDYSLYDDAKTVEEYASFTRAWLTEAVRVLDDNGSLWINLSNGLDYLVFPIAMELGLKCRQRVVWDRGVGMPQNRLFSITTETWLWFTKSSTYTFNLDAVRVPHDRFCKDGSLADKRNNPLGKNPTDIWSFTALTSRNKARPDHPCPYPIPMIQRIVKACSNEGDVVLDPFDGSGQSVLAAMAEKRHGVGIELDPNYHALALERVSAAAQ